MEIKQIKELMAAMERSGLTKLQIKKGSFELEMERKNGGVTPFTLSPEGEVEEPRLPQGYTLRKPSPLPEAVMSPAHPEGEPVKKEPVGTYVTSPMVGTFYSAPSPEDPPFLKVGDHIEKGTVVCIIEAMKVMNEIKAQVSGTVAEILLENGHPVEFGSKLFRIT